LDEKWRGPARNGLSFSVTGRYNSPLAWAGQVPAGTDTND
jgi:hypothetical protein